MSGSLNKVLLLGNVGKDPEIRSTSNGGKIGNLTLATSESWVDKASGERQTKTEWHRVSVFNDKLVDIIERFVKKGSRILVEGALQTRKWTDQQGQERYTTEVVLGRFNGQLVLLDGKRDGGSSSSDEPRQAARPAAAPAPRGGGDLDDEIPFGPCWQ